MNIGKFFGGKLSSRIAVIAFTVGTMVFTITPARAGFEWMPPAHDQMGSDISSSVEATPVPNVDSELLQDMLPTAEEEELRPSPVKSSKTLSHDVVKPKSFESVMGFGSDIPLVMVMHQIVPSDYSYSFDNGVNPGMRVSWTGGQPWNEVLSTSLSPLGLDAVISGNVVWIRPMEQAGNNAVPNMPQPVVTETAELPAPAPTESPIALTEPQSIPLHAPQPHDGLIVETTVHNDYQPSYPRRIPQSDASVSISMKGQGESSEARPVPLMPSPFATTAEPPAPSTPAARAPSAPLEPVAMPQMLTSSAPPSLDKLSGQAPVMDPFEIHFWHAEQGESLRGLLEGWSSKAGVAMLWDSSYDYNLPTPVRMHGTFPDAVTHILSLYNQSEPRPLGRLHPNLPDGPSVLVVENFTNATN